MVKRVLLPLIIIGAAIAVFMYMKSTKPESPTMAKPEKVWRVNTITASPQSYSPELTVYGRVETPSKSTLRSALSADVMTINAYEGDLVKHGDLLIQLDDRDVQLLVDQRQSDVDEIKAQIDSERIAHSNNETILSSENTLLALAEKSVERAQQLEQSRLTSRSNLDDTLAAKQRQVVTIKNLEKVIAEHPARLAQLKAKLDRAKALLEQAKLDLSRSQVIAPFDGRITKLSASVGNRVLNGDSLISLYDNSKLEVRAQIPNRFISEVSQQIAAGHRMTAVAEVNGSKLTFELQRLSGQVTDDSGGVDALFKLLTTNETLSLGTFVELNLQLPEHSNVIAIPYDALYGLNSVYLAKDGYLVSTPIQRIGEMSSDGQPVLLIDSADINKGDLIVSTQLPNAISGLKVEAVNE